MKYTDHNALLTEAEVLDGKKRLGKNQKARRATIAEQLSHVTQPSPTPRRASSGPDAYGRLGGDFQGNVFAMHSRPRNVSLRDMKRANKSGRGGIRFMRSRVQRTRRKQRTGGVR